MIGHYLKIAFRNLQKYKTQALISIIGLAMGIAFFIFALHWLCYETSYDCFYPKEKRTYMIYNQMEGGNYGVCSAIMATYIRQTFPEVESVTCAFNDSGLSYSVEGQDVKNLDFMVVDSAFIDCFPQKILYGTTLMHENEIIISETFARKYWKNPQEAIGCVLRQKGQPGIYISNPLQLQIVGIMANPPKNSFFQYSGYYQHSYRGEAIYDAKEWQFANAFVHFILKKGVDYNDFSRYLLSSLNKIEYLKEYKFNIIPLNRKHFEFAATESFSYSSICMFVAASLLLLCCVLFNFLNLFLNRYYQRLREIKLRKSIGASSTELMWQLMVEVILHFMLAGIICGCLLEVFTPFFEHLFSITIQGRELWMEYIVVLLAFVIVTVVLILFPVWQIVQISVIRTLTSKPCTQHHVTLKKIALIVQLIICLFFLISTTILHRQLSFMQQTDFGFDTKNIIEFYINTREQNGQNMLEEIKQLSMIQSHTTTSDYMITKEIRNLNAIIEWEGKTEEDKKIQFATLVISKGAEQVFNFRLLEGRTFTDEDWTKNNDALEDFITGRPVLNKILVTQKAVDLMRMKQPIGQVIRIPIILFGHNGTETHYTDYEIVGVIKDIHPQGMKSESYPTIIMQSFRFEQYLNYFRVLKGTEEDALKAMNALVQKYNWEYTGHNSEPQLLKCKMEEQSKSETVIFRLFSILSALCIIVSLFGIFSILSSTIAQRKKEIAVRKIMGGSISEIVGMFFREYLCLVCVAAIVAFPCSYMVMSHWLEQYAYHIHISINIFIIYLGITVILVLLTVLAQVVKAARQNPAEVIKSE